MTKKRCPLGEACDLTIAWMAGAARARDNISAGHLHRQLKVNRVGGAYIEDDEGMELDCVTMDGAFNLRAVAEGLRQGPDRVAPLEAEVKAQAAEIERLRGERERLALAICGGEDVPGYANAQAVETLEKVARDNHNATMEQINCTLAAEAKLENLLGGAETVLEAWDSGNEASFREAIEELRADVAEAKGAKP